MIFNPFSVRNFKRTQLAGNFYQGFGIVDRYMSQGKHAEARELMYSGALLFFSHNQVSLWFSECSWGGRVVIPRFEGVNGEFSTVNVWGNCFVVFGFISLLNLSPQRRIMSNWDVKQKCL